MGEAAKDIPSRRREEIARWAPWALSIGVHIAVVLLAFTIVWQIAAPEREERPLIIAAFDDPAPAALSPSQSPQEAAAPAPPPVAPGLPAPAQAPSLSELLAQLKPAPQEAVAQSKPAPAQDMVRERRLPDVRFAGMGASNVRSIVYVVDASGSTISTFPVILEELRRSARRLSPMQQFQVIFFGPGGYTAAPHPADGAQSLKTIRLIRATASNVKDVLAWAERVQPRERSNPIPALEIALGLRPDAVFVLSTAITGVGVWEPDRDSLLAQLDALNPADERGRRPVVIKTIQLFEDDPAGILRSIGQAHGGKDGYKFLSRREVLAQ